MAGTLGRLTASMALDEDLAYVISMATGLGVRAVKNRLQSARGNTLVRNALADDWPDDGKRLGRLTVAFARDYGLHEEITEATALSQRSVTRRLNAENGNKLLANAFPEMMGGLDEQDTDDAPLICRKCTPPKQLRDAHHKRNHDAYFHPVPPSSEETNGTRTSGAARAEGTGANWQALYAGRAASSSDAAGAERTVANSLVANRWRILRTLGEGGFGLAYEVRDDKYPEKGLEVLKVAKCTSSAERLRKEIGHAIRLHHQHICAYRHIEADDRIGTFVVMQHGGDSLEVGVHGRQET